MTTNNELQEKLRKHIEAQKQSNFQPIQTNLEEKKTEVFTENSFDIPPKIELSDAQKKAKKLRIDSINKQIDQKKIEQEFLLKKKGQLILEKKFDAIAEKEHNESINDIRNSIYDFRESIKKIEDPYYINSHRSVKINKAPSTPVTQTIHVIGVLLFICFLGVGFYGALFYKNPHNQPIKKDPNTINIEKQFSTWDGEHYQLSSQAKKALKFPDTYEHIDTVYFRNNDKQEITVKTTFIGQNAFGVKQRSCIMARYSFYGTELSQPVPC